MYRRGALFNNNYNGIIMQLDVHYNIMEVPICFLKTFTYYTETYNTR